MSSPPLNDGQRIANQQRRQQQDEQRQALRALLMSPLMGRDHECLALVRRHDDALRDWFARETGWPLQVEREGARLYKRPADLSDPTRGLPRYDRHRYTLLCLACAVLERAESQISLRTLGERLLVLAADPLLAARGFAFALQSPGERRALVTVCQTLLSHGVLQRVAGDEESYVQGQAQQGDALYDVRRQALSGLLAAVRGPSTWPADQAPISLDERLASLVSELVADTDEGRRTAVRHRLARRLLDDPVLYTSSLPADESAYFANQRGPLAARLAEASGLVPEQRAEGCALTDEGADLSDLALPAEGTDAHATLLVAEHLATHQRQGQRAWLSLGDIALFLAQARTTHGRHWRKQAREPGGEQDLAITAVQRLQALQLVQLQGEQVTVLPAVARFALGPVRATGRTPPNTMTSQAPLDC